MIRDSHLSGKLGVGQYYILDTGLVQRFYGLPPELIPPCGRCDTPTLVSGEIVGKYFYNRPKRLHVWCLDHVPLWIGALTRLQRLGWRLFRIPAHKWPW